MPKIQIDVPNNTYEKLKQEAKEHYQSLRAYVTYHLVQYTSNPEKFIDATGLPEGTTIRTTTASTTKPTPRRNIIKEAYDKEGIFEDRVHTTHSPFTDEEYKEEIDRHYPYCQDHVDFRQIKQYYDSFHSTPEELYEARERLIALSDNIDCQEHERVYLLQAFDFVPPADEPDLSITQYISQLAQGGWYNDPNEQHIFIKK